MEKFLNYIKNNKLYIITIGIAAAAVIAAVVMLVVFVTSNSVPASVLPQDETEAETVPEETVIESPKAEEPYVPFEKRSNGIDVSKWQGQIDWKKVKAAGIYFAFIRVGYRGENGKIYEDERAAYNLLQAEKNGILIGVYFFSTAVSVEEAEEEADWVLDYIAGHRISYPVVYDCEGFREEKSRMYKLTAEERTNNALAFLDKVKAAGYDTMHYGSRNDLADPECWDTALIERLHKIWVAMYTYIPYPYKDKPTYTGKCDAWQFSNKGAVNGIGVDVDLVVCYFVCDKAEPKDPDKTPTDIPVDDIPESDGMVHGVRFYKHTDKVTAKILVNLREYPSTGDEGIVGELKNGEYLQRTGISDQGWSRLEYNGKTVYAVSSYLIAEGASVETGEEREELYYFDSVSDMVTAKIETNLRDEPTTSGSEIIYLLKNGEYVKRIGINVSTGWSKLEYNGQIVYAISSYLSVKENIE